MATLKTICVYCGSGQGENPAFQAAARALGRALADADLRLVYGGGSVGLMGILARTVLDHGGAVTGIIPHFLQRREQMMDDVSELVVTDDMHERKMAMFERADAFVALPGGIGTLEELVEQMTWSQLGRHSKPVLLANICGFWDALLVLLQQMREQNFIRSGMEVGYLVADDAAAIVPMLQSAVANRPDAALQQAASGIIHRM